MSRHRWWDPDAGRWVYPEDRTTDRNALAEILHESIDGDFLVGAGRTIGQEGRDVPVREARISEVVTWAVDAVWPVLAKTWQEGHESICEDYIVTCYRSHPNPYHDADCARCGKSKSTVGPSHSLPVCLQCALTLAEGAS